jgi:hypothetical protein
VPISGLCTFSGFGCVGGWPITGGLNRGVPNVGTPYGLTPGIGDAIIYIYNSFNWYMQLDGLYHFLSQVE